MKRILISVLFILFFIVPILCWSAGTVTQSLAIQPNNSNLKILTFAWVGDAGGGTVPATNTNTEITKAIQGHSVYMVVTIPGSGVAPTNLYDITLKDGDGLDTMGGTLADRSATVTELALPKLESVSPIYGKRPVNGVITLTITNQNVNSATGTVRIYLTRE